MLSNPAHRDVDWIQPDAFWHIISNLNRYSPMNSNETFRTSRSDETGTASNGGYPSVIHFSKICSLYTIHFGGLQFRKPPSGSNSRTYHAPEMTCQQSSRITSWKILGHWSVGVWAAWTIQPKSIQIYWGLKKKMVEPVIN